MAFDINQNTVLARKWNKATSIYNGTSLWDISRIKPFDLQSLCFAFSVVLLLSVSPPPAGPPQCFPTNTMMARTVPAIRRHLSFALSVPVQPDILIILHSTPTSDQWVLVSYFIIMVCYIIRKLRKQPDGISQLINIYNLLYLNKIAFYWCPSFTKIYYFFSSSK